MTILAYTMLCAKSLATNVLWSATIPHLALPANSKLSSRTQQLEKESVSIDHSGRGIRIVCAERPIPGSFDMLRDGISFDHCTLSSAVETVAGSAGYGVIFVDDVALCFRRQTEGQPIYRTGVLRGRITDSLSNAPITNVVFTTKCLAPIANDVWIKADGSFVAAITYVTFRPNVQGLYICKRNDDTAILEVSAPEHISKKIVADFSDSVDLPFLNLSLEATATLKCVKTDP